MREPMMENEADLETVMAELGSAEEFLDYFGLHYDSTVVQVNRLHILQRFHDYITGAELPQEHDERWTAYRDLLARAYRDFVESDSRTEKVFRVFQQQGGDNAFVPLGSIGKGGSGDAEGI